MQPDFDLSRLVSPPLVRASPAHPAVPPMSRSPLVHAVPPDTTILCVHLCYILLSDPSTPVIPPTSKSVF